MAAILTGLIVGLSFAPLDTTGRVGPTPVELSDSADGEADGLEFELPDLAGVENGFVEPLLPARPHQRVDESGFAPEHSRSASIQRGPPIG